MGGKQKEGTRPTFVESYKCNLICRFIHFAKILHLYVYVDSVVYCTAEWIKSNQIKSI